MCRLAGYLGTPLALSAVLTESSHCLRRQGHAPRELPAGMLGADGYGFAWRSAHGDEPARYRQTLPIWADANLDTLAPHITPEGFVASTRTAEDAMPVSITNTPPFCFASLMAVHNGSISGFHEGFVDALRSRLEPGTRGKILGNTDSEYIIGWLADTRGADLGSRTRALLLGLRTMVLQHQTSAQLNLIALEGNQLVGARYAVNQPAPSLYFTRRGRRAALIASEPLSEDETWTRVPERGLVVVTRHPGGDVNVEQSSIDP
jgi:glutamine amidotransferase